MASYADAAGLDSRRAGAVGAVARTGEALGIDRRKATPADERAWAARLHRMADALSA